MDKLLEAAKGASVGAYCPYSGFAVGAAVELNNGSVVTGSNQECASSSLTICAERVALASALSQYPWAAVVRIAIFAVLTDDIIPCGACREFLQECARRSGDDIEIITVNGTYLLSELLPHPFILP